MWYFSVFSPWIMWKAVTSTLALTEFYQPWLNILFQPYEESQKPWKFNWEIQESEKIHQDPRVHPQCPPIMLVHNPKTKALFFRERWLFEGGPLDSHGKKCQIIAQKRVESWRTPNDTGTFLLSRWWMWRKLKETVCMLTPDSKKSYQLIRVKNSMKSDQKTLIIQVRYFGWFISDQFILHEQVHGMTSHQTFPHLITTCQELKYFDLSKNFGTRSGVRSCCIEITRLESLRGFQNWWKQTIKSCGLVLQGKHESFHHPTWLQFQVSTHWEKLCDFLTARGIVPTDQSSTPTLWQSAHPGERWRCEVVMEFFALEIHIFTQREGVYILENGFEDDIFILILWKAFVRPLF